MTEQIRSMDELAQRYADTTFVRGDMMRPGNRAWYIARLRKGVDPLADETDMMPRPWKAVRVDLDRYTFLQGTLSADARNNEELSTYFTASAGQLDVGPEITEEEARDWLREFNRLRDLARAA